MKRKKNLKTENLLLILLMLFSIHTMAQFNSSKVDSLRLLIKTEMPDDSIKVKHLLNYARSIYYEKPDSALIVFDQALNISQKT
ncbi:MAG TPA: hypothetical protein PK855_11530, partial [Bacteroidales bacterium]|nr:hypothetical protein [Bacteroidales bacterium]